MFPFKSSPIAAPDTEQVCVRDRASFAAAAEATAAPSVSHQSTHVCAPCKCEQTSSPERQHRPQRTPARAQRGAGRARVNHSQSPWERRAAGATSCKHIWDMLCVHGSLVPKSQLPRCSRAGLCPPSVCIFSLFPLGNKTLANLGGVRLCVGESDFPVTLEPAGQFPPDLTKGQRTQGELNSHSAIQNTVCNCMQTQSLCLTPQQCVYDSPSHSQRLARQSNRLHPDPAACLWWTDPIHRSLGPPQYSSLIYCASQ